MHSRPRSLPQHRNNVDIIEPLLNRVYIEASIIGVPRARNGNQKPPPGRGTLRGRAYFPHEGARARGKLNLPAGAPRIFRRTDLQGRLFHPSGRRPEARNDLAGLRRTVETAAHDLPLDLQQLRRVDERAGHQIRAGQAAQSDHEPLARLQTELHAGERHGLRHGRLLGEKSDRGAEDTLFLSDHRRREALPFAELHRPPVNRTLRVSNG